jgi:hypothetical protein
MVSTLVDALFRGLRPTKPVAFIYVAFAIRQGYLRGRKFEIRTALPASTEPFQLMQAG